MCLHIQNNINSININKILDITKIYTKYDKRKRYVIDYKLYKDIIPIINRFISLIQKNYNYDDVLIEFFRQEISPYNSNTWTLKDICGNNNDQYYGLFCLTYSDNYQAKAHAVRQKSKIKICDKVSGFCDIIVPGTFIYYSVANLSRSNRKKIEHIVFTKNGEISEGYIDFIMLSLNNEKKYKNLYK